MTTYQLEQRIKELEELVSVLTVRVKCADGVKGDLENIIEIKNLTIEKLNKLIDEDLKIIVSLRKKLKDITLNSN